MFYKGLSDAELDRQNAEHVKRPGGAEKVEHDVRTERAAKAQLPYSDVTLKDVWSEDCEFADCRGRVGRRCTSAGGYQAATHNCRVQAAKKRKGELTSSSPPRR